ncbi:putative transcriptional regulator [Inquilinus ginsengisoli]|uniref:Transcriptional regulator n=1 Tax=Inquilinus ginsengisoli TaxID=363840 RepID=A0ABU1JXK6_9PROT|nr:MucR family transcriptional regulator [Inquilinus ginsengisoli]MDR6292309.1 putative transcriptional regulator [Inquilinus ginsengisoli]
MPADVSSDLKPSSTNETRKLTAQIVAAHVSHNNVAVSDLAGLIGQVYGALNGLGMPSEPVPSRPEPAVPIKKSVRPDYIICLEDGKKLKMLKRHLQAAYGMTPDEYRDRWGLPADYPMVAPNYAKQRSTLAKSIGLGTRRPVEVVAPPPAPAKARRPRKAAAK